MSLATEIVRRCNMSGHFRTHALQREIFLDHCISPCDEPGRYFEAKRPRHGANFREDLRGRSARPRAKSRPSPLTRPRHVLATARRAGRSFVETQLVAQKPVRTLVRICILTLTWLAHLRTLMLRRANYWHKRAA